MDSNLASLVVGLSGFGVIGAGIYFGGIAGVLLVGVGIALCLSASRISDAMFDTQRDKEKINRLEKEIADLEENQQD